MAVMIDPSSPARIFTSCVDGLKKLYEKKIKPVEATYKFGEFYSPLLGSSDFDAKPMVLLIGQYSVGKTTFIRHLLNRDFPGQHIGPEPTTDRFLAVMHGPEERVIPGNTLAVQADMPFRATNKFGGGFLSKFQASILPAPILEEITLIDTPGILAGEKQSLGRTYDFTSVCEWFAERSDLILLLFDAHKLDISDELKRTIQALLSQSDKIRIVLNKADQIDGQQLMRVYGALMWSLGKVVQTPEVMRVFIGSFWDRPIQSRDFEALFNAERNDLFQDLHSLPRNSAFRKVNELVKRARLAKVHMYILSHLKNEMPMFFGKADKMAELIKGLDVEFRKIQQQFRLPPGDFPNIERFKTMLKNYDFDTFPKQNPKLVQSLEDVLSVDIPNLLQQFPYGDAPKHKVQIASQPYQQPQYPNVGPQPNLQNVTSSQQFTQGAYLPQPSQQPGPGLNTSAMQQTTQSLPQTQPQSQQPQIQPQFQQQLQYQPQQPQSQYQQPQFQQQLQPQFQQQIQPQFQQQLQPQFQQQSQFQSQQFQPQFQGQAQTQPQFQSQGQQPQFQPQFQTQPVQQPLSQISQSQQVQLPVQTQPQQQWQPNPSQTINTAVGASGYQRLDDQPASSLLSFSSDDKNNAKTTNTPPVLQISNANNSSSNNVFLNPYTDNGQQEPDSVVGTRNPFASK